MAKSRGDVRYGRIVFAWIADTRGSGKLRPALVLTPDDLIATEPQILVAAITTTFRSPPPRDHVPLPWHPTGSSQTRLTRRSAVVVRCTALIDRSEIVGFGGDGPGRIMLQIEQRMAELDD